jgi:aconitate hydratase
MCATRNPFGSLTQLPVDDVGTRFYRLSALEQAGIGAVSKLPYSLKVLLEALLRQVDGYEVTEEDVARLAAWHPQATS